MQENEAGSFCKVWYQINNPSVFFLVIHGVGSPTVGQTSSSVRLHIYVPSHNTTAISLNVTLSNQSHSHWGVGGGVIMLYSTGSFKIRMPVYIFDIWITWDVFVMILWPLSFGWLLFLGLYKEVHLLFLNVCPLDYTAVAVACSEKVEIP